MEIGERIKSRRIELGITQEELAKKIGYTSKTTIAKIESNANQLRQSKIIEIANALNTTPAFIMGWDEEEPPKLTGALALEHITLISKYSKLSDSNKILVNNLIDSLIANDVGQE